MTIEEQAKKALLIAANLLEEKGWCRNTFAKNKWGRDVGDVLAPEATNFCAIGSIKRVCWDNEEVRAKAIELASEEIPKDKDGDSYTLAAYNDIVCKSKKQIINLFRNAANKV